LVIVQEAAGVNRVEHSSGIIAWALKYYGKKHSELGVFGSEVEIVPW
jgi:hypothetical protein